MANLLTGDTADFTGGISTWNKSTGNSNFTLAHSATDGGVLSIDVTTGGANIAAASHGATAEGKPAVTAGNTITVGASIKQVDGSARSWRLEVNWYDESGPVGGSNVQVVSGTTTVGSYVPLSGDIEVPATVTRVRMRVWIGSPALNETFYVDDASIDDGAASTPTYTLTVNEVGNGSVAKDPDLAEYDEDTVVTLTATADSGWDFTGWSGDLAGSTNPDTVTMTADKTVTATFEEEPPAGAGDTESLVRTSSGWVLLREDAIS